MKRDNTTAMIKTIFFDVGGTLLLVEWGRVFETLGVKAAPAEMAQVERRGRLVYAARAASGTARIYEYLACCVEATGAVASEAQYERLWQRHLERNLWRAPAPQAEETLQALSRRGFRLGVISNSEGKVKELLQETKLAHYFEVIVDSGVEGVAKPDREIFRRACERMQVNAAEALYVGDVYALDVLGARGAGMHAALVDPHYLYEDEARDLWVLRSLDALVTRLSS